MGAFPHILMSTLHVQYSTASSSATCKFKRIHKEALRRTQTTFIQRRRKSWTRQFAPQGTESAAAAAPRTQLRRRNCGAAQSADHAGEAQHARDSLVNDAPSARFSDDTNRISANHISLLIFPDVSPRNPIPPISPLTFKMSPPSDDTPVVKYQRSVPASQLKKHPLWQQLALAGSSCAIATSLTHPIDTVKLRLQLQGAYATESTARYSGLFSGLFRVVRDEGFFALYMGLSPAVLRAWTSGATRLGMYEPLRNRFTETAGLQQPTFAVKVSAAVCSGALGKLSTVWSV